jgi:hypothetical protein
MVDKTQIGQSKIHGSYYWEIEASACTVMCCCVIADIAKEHMPCIAVCAVLWCGV